MPQRVNQAYSVSSPPMPYKIFLPYSTLLHTAVPYAHAGGGSKMVFKMEKHLSFTVFWVFRHARKSRVIPGLTLPKAKRPGKAGAHKAGGARHYTTGLHTRSDRAISGWPLSLIATSKLVKPLVEEQFSTK